LSSSSLIVYSKPDYGLVVDGETRWIIDAKAPSEDVRAHLAQCSGYCHALNKQQDDNLCLYFLVTNGLATELYRWDREDEPLLTLDFDDFADGGTGLAELAKFVGPDSVRSAFAPVDTESHLVLRRPGVQEMNSVFAWCHRQIYRKENLSYGAAFMAFVKLVFLKLLSDQRIRSEGSTNSAGDLVVPVDKVNFSLHWIDSRSQDTPNPLATIQFADLVKRFEKEIASRKKKRIFDEDETLPLSAETIRHLVERLEGIDLFGIDEDLNGRLFETFLNATLRGKDLGQYFTPRSVVKLALALVSPTAGRSHIDTVLDACCGSGGFLIEALAHMWHEVDMNQSLSASEREAIKQDVADSHIYGVDIAQDPNLARIARINMYLHGDGGSSIYQLDALDKLLPAAAEDSAELANEKAEFRKLAAGDGFADIVFTNPPFAKEYERTESGAGREDRILDEYALATYQQGRQVKNRKSLRSSIMFIERYLDVLRPGGRMITVIDDSVLGSSSSKTAREWIRSQYIIEAVVSLPGDAFQRSQARVKTSLLILRKKADVSEEQPAVFMYYCQHVGVDDPPRQRVLPIDETNRERARDEVDRVGALFSAFRSGDPAALAFTVDPEKLHDRIDVKACLLTAGRKIDEWTAGGHDVRSVSELAVEVSESDNQEDLIETADSDELVVHLRVRYDGFAEVGDEIFASDSKYSKLRRVHTGDIVVSNINAVHGATAVVPAELDGCVVTTEYTVIKSLGAVDTRTLWLLLRSPEARAEMLLTSTGIGRTRVKWDDLKTLQLPIPTTESSKKIAAAIADAEAKEDAATELRERTTADAYDRLRLTSDEAFDIIAGFKPPR